jgi:hypothetical protein
MIFKKPYCPTVPWRGPEAGNPHKYLGLPTRINITHDYRVCQERDYEMNPTETIFASDCPFWKPVRQCFSKIRHSSFRRCSFQPPIDLKIPFPLLKITGYSTIPAAF